MKYNLDANFIKILDTSTKKVNEINVGSFRIFDRLIWCLNGRKRNPSVNQLSYINKSNINKSNKCLINKKKRFKNFSNFYLVRLQILLMLNFWANWLFLLRNVMFCLGIFGFPCAPGPCPVAFARTTFLPCVDFTSVGVETAIWKSVVGSGG